jgi:ribonucleotide monophosphatase NagD (HAD superfamily)
VKRIGKPFPDVYEMALQSVLAMSDNVNKSRICMVGDALETDVAGGTRFGIDTVWVLKNGVHSIDIYTNDNNNNVQNNDTDLMQSANRVLDNFNANCTGTYAEGLTLSPTFVVPCFQW